MKNRIIPTENRIEMAIVLTMFVVVVLLVIGVMREIQKRKHEYNFIDSGRH